MPYYRRYRRRTYRRKTNYSGRIMGTGLGDRMGLRPRTAARTARRRSLYGSINTHRYKRTYGSGPIQTSGTTGQFLAGYYFTLDALPNYTELTALYDSYRIDYIVFRLSCRTNNADLNTMTTNDDTSLPIVYTVIDRDDSVNPASIDELREYSKCKIHYIGEKNKRTIYIKWKPNNLQQLYLSAVATGYAPVFGQYLDCANPNIPYYGLKLGIDAKGSGVARTTYVFDVEQTLYFTMKDVR